MTLTGLHILLTYGCTYECDHCFVWSGPRLNATFTIARLDDVLEQARTIGTIKWIYFEGGEPFLYDQLLRYGVRRASGMGFRVGMVSNAYWATAEEDATEWLRELAGRIQDLSFSCDAYHGDAEQERRVEVARAAAERLGIPVSVIRITDPGRADAPHAMGQLPPGESTLMFRGRAAEALSGRVPHHPGATFTSCPYEDLREPGRVHLDPHGVIHLCQGISLGNVFEKPLSEIVRTYRPDAHPIAEPLLDGGPAELARRYDLPLAGGWADACHLCYATRKALRSRFPDVLTPDEMYGEVPAG